MSNNTKREHPVTSDAASGALATVALTGIGLMMIGPDWFTEFFSSSDGGWTLLMAGTLVAVATLYFLVLFVALLVAHSLVAAVENHRRGSSL